MLAAASPKTEAEDLRRQVKTASELRERSAICLTGSLAGRGRGNAEEILPRAIVFCSTRRGCKGRRSGTLFNDTPGVRVQSSQPAGAQ